MIVFHMHLELRFAQAHFADQANEFHWSSVKTAAGRIVVTDLISTLVLYVGAGSIGVVFLKTPLLL